MNFVKDKLEVSVSETRDIMGKVAAQDIADCINKMADKEEINMIFAAAPSQNDVLYHLCERTDIDWTKINAFHMDEYIGLPNDAPQKFSNFLIERIFSEKPFKSVNFIDSSTEAGAKSYGELLLEYPVDIVVMGIGENGHIAFNDPHVADFNDKELVKVVKLDDMCRQQQVNDGCFDKFDDVPEFALTLTIPSLTKAAHLFCIVPCSTKANAVYNTINGDINEKCPATILRLHNSAKLYCDGDSAKLIKG